jgi:LPS export ABC transporter protein LptC
LVVGSLVFLLAIGAAMLARSFWQQRKVDLALEVIELLPEVAQRIQDFHRVKFDGDRKLWEVSAKEARYFEDDGVVAVHKPVVEIFFEEGRSIALRGNEGKVTLDGSDVESVEIEGRLDVKLDEYALRTDLARYETKTDRIVVPGSVHVESAQLEFDGEAMEIDVGGQRLRVDQGVRMTLWPKG